MPAIQELSASILLFSSQSITLAVAVYNLYETGALGPVAALAIVTMVIITAAIALATRLGRGGRRVRGSRARGPASRSDASRGTLMAAIAIDRITKRFGATVAVRSLSLQVEDREFVTLLGPERLRQDDAAAPDRRVHGARRGHHPSRRATRSRRRPVWCRPSGADGDGVPELRGVAAQERVRQRRLRSAVRRVPRAEIRARVARVLELVNLAGLEARYPSELSGGQQQRVALARSLVVEPAILLLDEPLSNLDAKLRERMRWELRRSSAAPGITFVYVTHDQSEALALSDRIAVMHPGELQQYGTPREVYTRPANRTVADFMGLVNLIPARVRRAGSSRARRTRR